MTTSYDSGTKTAADAPSSYSSGVSHYSVSGDDGWEGDGTLVVYKGGFGAGTTQVLHTFGQVWTRHASANSWGSWTRLATV